MTVKNTESLCNSSSVWARSRNNSSGIYFFKIIAAITTIACPFTILLILSVITAARKRRELKNISNILLSSVALTDLLVGAVSIPLCITLDALVIQRGFLNDGICMMFFRSVSVLYTVCSSSFCHLLLIAWERYVAVAKWM